MSDVENINNFLEPACLVLLSLNQRHIVEKYLKLISVAQNDEHKYLYYMFFNYVRSPDVDVFEKSYSYLEALESLPFNEKYDTKKYREFADWCKTQLG